MVAERLTLGSLFDGAGGFPLAGMMAGFTPIWASEIEPFPVLVTQKRLPFVKHYGDVSALNGAGLPPVDIITFGSPCQDMSIAGKREGLGGSRSNLFYEAIRIVKEMREATNGEKPEFIVWENVPGAFSSNGGEDFRTVLEEIAKTKDGAVSIPRPDKGKWQPAGEIVGNGYSIAWRTYDAQYWGVPQRRKRIYLVADLAGRRAGHIQFDRESLCGNPAQGSRGGQGTAGTPQKDTGTPIRAIRGSIIDRIVQKARVYENHWQDSRCSELGESGETVVAKYGTGGNNTPIVVEPRAYSIGRDYKTVMKEKAGTLTHSTPPQIVIEPQKEPEYPYRARWLTPLECARLQGFPDWWCSNLATENPTDEDVAFWRDVFETHRKVIGTSSKPKTENQIVKWLKNPYSNSAEYKMWGNSLAIPCAYTVLAGIAEVLTESERWLK